MKAYDRPLFRRGYQQGGSARFDLTPTTEQKLQHLGIAKPQGLEALLQQAEGYGGGDTGPRMPSGAALRAAGAYLLAGGARKLYRSPSSVASDLGGALAAANAAQARESAIEAKQIESRKTRRAANVRAIWADQSKAATRAAATREKERTAVRGIYEIVSKTASPIAKAEWKKLLEQYPNRDIPIRDAQRVLAIAHEYEAKQKQEKSLSGVYAELIKLGRPDEIKEFLERSKEARINRKTLSLPEANRILAAAKSGAVDKEMKDEEAKTIDGMIKDVHMVGHEGTSDHLSNWALSFANLTFDEKKSFLLDFLARARAGKEKDDASKFSPAITAELAAMETTDHPNGLTRETATPEQIKTAIERHYKRRTDVAAATGLAKGQMDQMRVFRDQESRAKATVKELDSILNTVYRFKEAHGFVGAVAGKFAAVMSQANSLFGLINFNPESDIVNRAINSVKYFGGTPGESKTFDSNTRMFNKILRSTQTRDNKSIWSKLYKAGVQNRVLKSAVLSAAIALASMDSKDTTGRITNTMIEKKIEQMAGSGNIREALINMVQTIRARVIQKVRAREDHILKKPILPFPPRPRPPGSSELIDVSDK